MSETISTMILAAGLGNRLFPLTQMVAKPAIPFLNRPLIHFVIDLLADLDTNAIIVNLHYLPDSVISAVRTYAKKRNSSLEKLKIQFSSENPILGTAGGVRAAINLLGGDDILIINGKIYSEINLCPIVAQHQKRGALATLVVVPWSPGSPFNPVRVDSNSRVLGFGFQGLGKHHTFTGIQIIKKSVLSRIPKGPLDFVKNVYPFLLKNSEIIEAHVTQSLWYECSTPERYFRGSFEVIEKSLTPWIGQQFSKISPHIISASDCLIGRGSKVENTILWNRVQIGKNCTLRNAIICSKVKIPDGFHLKNAIVTPILEPRIGFPVRPKKEKGCLIWPFPQE